MTTDPHPDLRSTVEISPRLVGGIALVGAAMMPIPAMVDGALIPGFGVRIYLAAFVYLVAVGLFFTIAPRVATPFVAWAVISGDVLYAVLGLCYSRPQLFNVPIVLTVLCSVAAWTFSTRMLVLKLLVMTGCVYVGLSPSYPNNPALHLAETGVHAGVLTLVTWWLHLMRRRMITLTQRLQFLSDTDALTGLHNRRYLDQHVGEVVDSARTSGRRLAALVIDLDHFKRINDALGHEAGDRVLVAVANSIRSVLHSGELLARTGGEELLILTAVTTHSLAVRLAELVRQAVIESGTPIDITCSVGVATALVPAQEDPTRFVWALVSRADRAMYRAKLAGRNLVVEDDNDVGEG